MYTRACTENTAAGILEVKRLKKMREQEAADMAKLEKQVEVEVEALEDISSFKSSHDKFKLNPSSTRAARRAQRPSVLAPGHTRRGSSGRSSTSGRRSSSLLGSVALTSSNSRNTGRQMGKRPGQPEGVADRGGGGGGLLGALTRMRTNMTGKMDGNANSDDDSSDDDDLWNSGSSDED